MITLIISTAIYFLSMWRVEWWMNHACTHPKGIYYYELKCDWKLVLTERPFLIDIGVVAMLLPIVNTLFSIGSFIALLFGPTWKRKEKKYPELRIKKEYAWILKKNQK